jgi:hypothetical protein
MLTTSQEAAASAPNGRPRVSRSRVTNGKSVFFGATDQRSPMARRFKDLCFLHSHDLSPRGPEHLTQAQQQLIRRIASLEVQLETMEAKMVEGVSSTDDIESFARISSHLRRMLETLGLDRVMRDATPTVAQVAAGFGSGACRRRRQGVAPRRRPRQRRGGSRPRQSRSGGRGEARRRSGLDQPDRDAKANR